MAMIWNISLVKVQFRRLEVQFRRLEVQFRRLEVQFRRLEVQFRRLEVQYRRLELFKKKGALFQEEFYFPVLFRILLTNWWYIFLWMAMFHVYFSKFLFADETSRQDHRWLPHCFHCQTEQTENSALNRNVWVKKVCQFKEECLKILGR